MTRRVVTGLAVFALAMVVVPGALAAGSRPVLGWGHASINGRGLGAVAPLTVYLGGDPTGEVSKLRWHHWSGSETVGFGQGWCPGRSVADGHFCNASLHLSNLGA